MLAVWMLLTVVLCFVENALGMLSVNFISCYACAATTQICVC
jgi:hypothetical protein